MYRNYFAVVFIALPFFFTLLFFITLGLTRDLYPLDNAHAEHTEVKNKGCLRTALILLFRNGIYQPNRFIFRVKCVFIIIARVT